MGSPAPADCAGSAGNPPWVHRHRRGCTPGSPQNIVHPCGNGPTGLRPLRIVYGYLLYWICFLF